MIVVDAVWLWLGVVVGKADLKPRAERALNVAMGGAILATSIISVFAEILLRLERRLPSLTAMDRRTEGLLCGLVGVLIFSGSLPATRAAVIDIDPALLTIARSTIAGAISLALLAASRQRLPKRSEINSLIVVVFGVVIGFPLFTALALHRMDASHAIMFIGLLPLSTAIFGVLRGRECPGTKFWVFAAVGAFVLVSFAISRGSGHLAAGDLIMLASIVVCGLGYAEGAVLSRTLGSWQAICWGLVLALPFSLTAALLMHWPDPQSIGRSAWIGGAYVSIFSTLIGFFFWYRGLALGGIAAVGQLQLLQPLLGLILAGTLLHEAANGSTVLVTSVVIVCVAGARRHASPRGKLALGGNERS